MKAYIYPNSKWKGINNPYLENFVHSLRGRINFVNFENTAKTGLLDIFLYVFKINIIFFNWIEDVPTKKGGTFQWYTFRFIILPLLKIRKVKIVYVLHNNISHYKEKLKLKNKIFNTFFKHGDVILTHAKEGLHIINSKVKNKSTMGIYYPHPFNKRERYSNPDKEIDILSWGSISPYKGIHLFLEQVEKDPFMRKLNILICGKFMDKKYEEFVLSKIPENVTLVNRFIPENELNNYLSKSKITLFVYSSDSVLSSGALADSIGYGNIVLGPAKGAFEDLKQFNLTRTFNNVNDLIPSCKRILQDFGHERNKSLAHDFIEKHSWENFSVFFYDKLLNNKA
jgi:glycosyltransferase involved in cell wall biosynthesis